MCEQFVMVHALLSCDCCIIRLQLTLEYLLAPTKAVKEETPSLEHLTGNSVTLTSLVPRHSVGCQAPGYEAIHLHVHICALHCTWYYGYVYSAEYVVGSTPYTHVIEYTHMYGH